MGDCVLPAFIGQKSRRRDHETSRLDMRQPTPAPLSPALDTAGNSFAAAKDAMKALCWLTKTQSLIRAAGMVR